MIHTFDELEEKAKKFINGEIEPLEIVSLPVIERLYTLECANTYSLCMIGTLSSKSTAACKKAYINESKNLQSEILYVYKIWDQWVQRTKKFSGITCELAKALQSNDYDKDDVLELSLHIIDLLTKDDIFVKLYHQKLQDKNFKSHAIKTGAKEVDNYIEKWGNKIPYAQLLEKFYDCMCSDKIGKVWEQLDPDTFEKRARHVPIKSDDNSKIINSIKTTYEINKNVRSEQKNDKL